MYYPDYVQPLTQPLPYPVYQPSPGYCDVDFMCYSCRVS